MAKPSLTIQRTLHFPVWELAQQYEKVHGTLKMSVSAGLIVFSRLTADERNKIVLELKDAIKQKPGETDKEQPRVLTVRQALVDMVERTRAKKEVPAYLI